MLGVFAIAFTGHTIHNAASSAIARGVGLAGPAVRLAANVAVGFTILVLAAKWARRTELRWFTRVMQDELDTGVLTRAELHR